MNVRDPLRWCQRQVHDHPLLCLVVLSSLVAAGHAVWIWHHRHLGGYDPDEAGYMATALRIDRSIGDVDPVTAVRSIVTAGSGLTVPVLTVPFVLFGPRDPRMALMVQPVLMVCSSVAVAGATRRLAGPIAAVAAGALFCALPTVSVATQSYWYGLGATTCLAVALWALLASDRCEGRAIWGYGVALGLMLLARTMTLGYLPALVVAGLIVAGAERRRLQRLGAAVLLGLAIAAPWYLINRSSIFGYLVSYGYGDRAALFGDGDVWQRGAFRWSRYADAFGSPTFVLLCSSAACVAVLVAWRERRGAVTFDRLRPLLSVAALLGIGSAALISTSNNGVWFELPLVAVATVLLVAVISKGPSWYSAGLTAVLTVVSVASLGAAWWVTPFDGGQTSHYEYGFEHYDERFGPDRRDEHRIAAAEWAAANSAVLSAVHRAFGSDVVITLSGNMQLLNANSLLLTGELDGRPPDIRIPDTAMQEERLLRDLTPRVGEGEAGAERAVLIERHDRQLFTPDADVERFAELARRNGWSVVDEVPIPTGGVVEIMRHDDGSRT